MKWLHCFALLLVFAASYPAGAVQPDEILSDATLEARARVLSRELRCMVCQNQSIDDWMRRLRATCASWCVSGSNPATATPRCSNSSLRVTASSCCRPSLSGHVLLWLAPAVLLIAGAAVSSWLRGAGAASIDVAPCRLMKSVEYKTSSIVEWTAGIALSARQ